MFNKQLKSKLNLYLVLMIMVYSSLNTAAVLSIPTHSFSMHTAGRLNLDLDELASVLLWISVSQLFLFLHIITD